MRPLWKHQEQALEWMKTHQNVIIADDVGLGKTAEAILGIGDASPVLIVCTESFRYVWRQEIMDWAGCKSEDVCIIGETRATIRPPRWYIVYWEDMLDRLYKGRVITKGRIHLLANVRWGAVIVDEAHKMKNRQALRTKYMNRLQSKRRVLLTATALVNQPGDVWSLLHFLEPRKFTSYWNFFHEHVYAIQNIFGGWDIIGLIDKNRFREVLQPYVLLRLKKDVFKDLPPKLYQSIPVKLNVEELKAYHELVKTMQTELDLPPHLVHDFFEDPLCECEVSYREHDSTAHEFFPRAAKYLLMTPTKLARFTRLRQICVGLGTLTGDLTASSSKLDAVKALLAERVDENGKPLPTLVASQFRWPVEALNAQLPALGRKPVLLVGSMGPGVADANVRAYQEGRADTLLMTSQTGGEQWTLTAGDTLITIDDPWSPTIKRQLEGRLREHLQGRPVHIISLDALDTVEDRVRHILHKKDGFFRDAFEDWRNDFGSEEIGYNGPK